MTNKNCLSGGSNGGRLSDGGEYVQSSIIIKIQLLEITCFKLGTDGMGKNLTFCSAYTIHGCVLAWAYSNFYMARGRQPCHSLDKPLVCGRANAETTIHTHIHNLESPMNLNNCMFLDCGRKPVFL